MRIPLASAGLRDIDIAAAVKVLNSGNLTMGSEVLNFESKMAEYLGVKFFTMVNSGSSANLLMLEALMRPTHSNPALNPGDSILVPAIAWPTTVWPLIQLGLNPVFVDVDPKTIAIDLSEAQKIIDTTRIPIRGIFPIHPLGYAIPPSKLDAFVKKNGLVLINDVCESLGSWSEGVHAGTSGIAASFSFYFSHHITTMEGGGIATDDAFFADDLRSMRSHGWSRDRSDVNDWTESMSSNDAKFLFVSTGYNVRPMEVQAAIGSLQIDSLDNFVQKRRNIARMVSFALKNTILSVVGDETLQNSNEEKSHSWMLIPIMVHGEDATNVKKSIIQELQNLDIETRPVLTGNFLAQPAIQRITRHSADPLRFEVANKIASTCFLVGAHHDLSEEQINYLCTSLKKIAQIFS